MTDEFSFIAPVAEIGLEPKFHTLRPDAAACATIAKRVGAEAVASLTGDLELAGGRDGFSVRGRLRASLVRQCVVSLEPMQEEIDEAFEMRFERDLVDDEDDDSPVYREPLDFDQIDLAELLVQQLSLMMAPHPRKPGAAPPAPLGAKDVIDGPFASLKRLVDDGSESPP
jgi:uncharacterized metal-binding protein YceD (DUF177 family)